MKKEVRFFKHSEKEILLDAIDRLWAHNHIYVRNPAVLEHLVWDTPYREDLAGKDNYSFVGMWVDGEVVGLRGSIPQEANVFGRIVKSRTSTVWIVKKQKGLSINGMDMELFIDQIRPPEMIVGLGLSEINVKLRRLWGAYTLDDVPRWIVVNRFDETVKYLLTDETKGLFLPLVQFRSNNSYLHIEVDELCESAWDDYYFTVVAPRTIGTCRDYKFLHWRYMKSPVLKYHFLTIRNNQGNYLGLAVIRLEPILEGKYSVGRILEFISFDIEASITLATAILEYDKTVLLWDFYCFSDVTAFGLEAVGFRKIPEWNNQGIVPTRFQPIDHDHMKINAAVRVNEAIKKQLNPVNLYQWYLTKGDADQDRAN